MIDIDIKQLMAAGLSHRMALYVRKQERRLSPDKAAEVERLTGISRLHILFPDEFGPDGQPIQVQPDEAQAHG